MRISPSTKQHSISGSHIETIVKGLERYHTYTLGADLRNHSQKLLFAIHKANATPSGARTKKLLKLRNRCEKLKMLTVLARELKAFRSPKQFEYAGKLAVTVCKQAQRRNGDRLVFRQQPISVSARTAASLVISLP